MSDWFKQSHSSGAKLGEHISLYGETPEQTQERLRLEKERKPILRQLQQQRSQARMDMLQSPDYRQIVSCVNNLLKPLKKRRFKIKGPTIDPDPSTVGENDRGIAYRHPGQFLLVYHLTWDIPNFGSLSLCPHIAHSSPRDADVFTVEDLSHYELHCHHRRYPEPPAGVRYNNGLWLKDFNQENPLREGSLDIKIPPNVPELEGFLRDILANWAWNYALFQQIHNPPFMGQLKKLWRKMLEP